jgi:hypothetical protein
MDDGVSREEEPVMVGRAGWLGPSLGRRRGVLHGWRTVQNWDEEGWRRDELGFVPLEPVVGDGNGDWDGDRVMCFGGMPAERIATTMTIEGQSAEEWMCGWPHA